MGKSKIFRFVLGGVLLFAFGFSGSAWATQPYTENADYLKDTNAHYEQTAQGKDAGPAPDRANYQDASSPAPVNGETSAQQNGRTESELSKLKAKPFTLKCEYLNGDTYPPAFLPGVGATTLHTKASTQATAVKTSSQEIETQRLSCAKAAKAAQIACIETNSIHIKGAMAALGGLTAVVGGVTSITNSCSKFADATKIVNIALTAYNTACTATMMICNSSCGKLDTKAKSLKGELPAKAQLCSGGLPQDNPTVAEFAATAAKVHTSCQGYKYNLMAAGAGMLAMIAQFGISKNCEKKTANAGATAIDCTKEANFGQTVCICQTQPNTPGCAGAMGGTTGSGTNSKLVGTTIDQNSKGTLSGAGGGIGYDDSRKNGSTDSKGFAANGAGGSVGGAGDGAGGTSGFTGAAGGPAAKTTTGKGLDTNISGDGDSGGGGGGGRGGGGGYGADLDPNSPYKSYVPGGKNDPNRGLASAYTSQVTGGGGKSNWEKVNQRYRDQKPTLLDQ